MELLEEKSYFNPTSPHLTQSSPVLTPFQKKGEGNCAGEAFPLSWNCSPGVLSLLPTLPPAPALGGLPRTGERKLMPLSF